MTAGCIMWKGISPHIKHSGDYYRILQLVRIKKSESL